MRYIAASYPGIEDISITEIKELTGAKGKIECPGRVVFETENVEKLLNARSIDAIYSFVARFKFKSLEDIEEKAEKVDFSFIKKDFVVRCTREGEHDFNSIDVERALGQVIFKKKHKVNLASKNIILADIINNEILIGALIKRGMHKRDYRVKLNRQGINPCMSYALLRILGYKKGISLLDGNALDGMLLIEAAKISENELYGMFANESDYISAGLNSRLAKAKLKLLHPKDDLDTGKIDYAISYLPSESKKVSKNFVKKCYSNFFNLCKELESKMILVYLNNDEGLKEYLKEFKVLEKRNIIAGKSYFVYLLQKSK